MTPLIAAVLPLAFASASDDYQFRAVDFPGAANTAIYAVNNRGHFVGAEQAGSFSSSPHHAIVDDGMELRFLDPTGVIGNSGDSQAFSINNLEDIAGYYTDDAGVQHGFVHHADGRVTTIDFPEAIDTQAFGVNDFGTVIGIYVDAQGNTRSFAMRDGHLSNIDLPGGLANGGTTPLSINDLGQIVGEYIQTAGTNGFGYLQAPDGRFTLVTAPGSAPQQTLYISINNHRQILGQFADAAGVQHNFLQTGGDFQPFDLPARFAAVSVSAQTVNDHDEIVGLYFDASKVAHGFVATKAEH
jgi:hypothetical protein